jgi:hypothetical protein
MTSKRRWAIGRYGGKWHSSAQPVGHDGGLVDRSREMPSPDRLALEKRRLTARFPQRRRLVRVLWPLTGTALRLTTCVERFVRRASNVNALTSESAHSVVRTRRPDRFRLRSGPRPSTRTTHTRRVEQCLLSRTCTGTQELFDLAAHPRRDRWPNTSLSAADAVTTSYTHAFPPCT